MTQPYDNIDHKLILALRAGTTVSEQALLAHFSKGNGRAHHIRSALVEANRLEHAAAALRAEVERIEAAESEVA